MVNLLITYLNLSFLSRCISRIFLCFITFLHSLCRVIHLSLPLSAFPLHLYILIPHLHLLSMLFLQCMNVLSSNALFVGSQMVSIYC